MPLPRQCEFLLSNKVEKFSSDGLIALILIMATSMISTAIISPLVFNLVLFFEKNYHTGVGRYLVTKGLGAFFDRIRWIPIGIGIVVLTKKFRFTKDIFIGKLRWQSLGYGFLIGLALVFLATIPHCYLSPSSRTISKPENPITTLIYFLMISASVAFFEEIVFRNILLKIFYTAFRPIIAVILSSMFFAYMHFKGHISLDENGYTSIKDGFLCAYSYITSWITYFSVVEFSTLTLLGMLLCLITLRYQSLAIAIGIHWGMVFSLLTYKEFAHISTAPLTFFGTHRVTDSPFVVLLLSLAVIGAYYLNSFSWQNRVRHYH
ncbi:MAG: CPBP family intramembrane metalloprotease [Puniceicoccales bacterium]|jgi:membrane protease YdiL (CAAX protease family)|nr:CPBP family intramembrane metalloprotease [Puniceicoccales bacterium]